MLVNIFNKAYHIFTGLICVFFGALVSYVGFMFVAVQLIGEVEFDKVILIIGLVSLMFGPPSFVAGIRLLLNKPTKYGGLISPVMLRIFAVFYAIIGGLSFWLVFKQNVLMSIIVAISFILATQQAFSLANKREKSLQA